jgi:alkyl hydroperoxide reductase subunit AhpC
MPRNGEKAPAFKAITHPGRVDFPKDYDSVWVILFSHSPTSPPCALLIHDFRHF